MCLANSHFLAFVLRQSDDVSDTDNTELHYTLWPKRLCTTMTWFLEPSHTKSISTAHVSTADVLGALAEIPTNHSPCPAQPLMSASQPMAT